MIMHRATFTQIEKPELILFYFILFIYSLFRAAPEAHGGSQASGQIGDVAAGLHYIHNNARSEPPL